MNFRVDAKPHNWKAKITAAYHQAVEDESICASNDCEELGLHYIPYPYSDSGEALVCHSHLQDTSDYSDSR